MLRWPNQCRRICSTAFTQRKSRRMSDYHNHPVPENPTSGDTAPGNPEDSSANPRIAYAQLPYGTARTQQPMYAARPVGRQPVGMPMQPPPQQRQRRESRFSYKTGVPPRRNGKWMPDQQCGFGNAIKRFFDGYAEFKGRSSRREFWLTMLPIAPITVLPFFLPAFRNAHRAALVIVYRDTVPGRFHTKAA